MQHLSDIEKTDSEEENFSLKWTIQNGRRRIRANFKTDTDYFNFVAYRHRNNLYLKDNEIGLKLKEYQSPLAKQFYVFELH